MMEKQIKQVYATPEVGVYETEVCALICQSEGSINSMGKDEDGGGYFN